MLDQMRREAKHSLRALLKTPAFTFVAILTLTLGLGVNSAIFSIVNGWLFRPLPVQNPDQLVVLASKEAGKPSLGDMSYADFIDYKAQADTFSDMLAYDAGPAGLRMDNTTSRIFVSYVTSNYFQMLGLKPELGQLPMAGDELSSPPVLVLGYSYWKERFRADPGIIGKSVFVDAQPVTVVGVLPASFHGLYAFLDMQGYLPLRLKAKPADAGKFWQDRNRRNLLVLARVRPGKKLQQVQASLQLIAQRLQQQYPDSNKGVTVEAFPEWQARPDADSANSALLVTVIFLLLATSVLVLTSFNLVNLFLVRATVRQQQLSVRAALGASRWSLVVQVLAEVGWIVVAGSALGLLLGTLLSRAVAAVPLQLDIPIRLDFSFDWRVALYGLLLVLVTTMIVGIIPAWRARLTNITQLMQDSSRTSSGGRGMRRIRSALVIVQFAGSLMLLIAAGLFVRSLNHARTMDFGFDPSNVFNFSVDPVQAGYDEVHARAFHQQLLDRVRALPGIESVALAYDIPFGYRHKADEVHIEGHPLQPGERAPRVFYNIVTAEYFKTMRVRLVKGREFTNHDDANAPKVAIINESMARRSWPSNEDPLGKRFSRGSASSDWFQVVGVVQDGKYLTPADRGRPYFYVPLAQNYASPLALQVRSSMPASTIFPQVAGQIMNLDPAITVFDVNTMMGVLQGGNGLFPIRLAATLASALGLLGLVLAVVGVYGVVAYGVSQRTQEIAIRMAMGAQKNQIRGMVFRHGLRLVLLGLGLGLLLAVAIAQSISGILLGVRPLDPLVFIVVSLVLSLVTLTACYFPARRATGLNILDRLRHE